MNKIKSEIKKEIGWGPMVVALLMVSNILGFPLPAKDIISYTLIIAIAIYNLRGNTKFDSLMGAFAIYIPISLIVITGPDPIFKSWQRFVLFIFLMIAISPLVQTREAKDFRLKLFKGILLCCALIGVLSFIGYFIGINFMRSTWDGSIVDYRSGVGSNFGGMTVHSMLLAPVSGIGAIVCIHLSTIYRSKRIYYYAATLMCIGCVLFSLSRATLIATLIGILVYFLCSSKGLGKNMTRIAGVAIILAVTSPLWGSALDGIRAKNQGDISGGINTGSRDEKWGIRIHEWETSPIFGIGFCSVSKDDDIGFGGRIEPGSSWLAVLSMTGIIGLALFFSIYFRACKKSMTPHHREGALFGGIVVLFGIHMIAEGYIYSAGSFLCWLAWLSLACATDYRASHVKSGKQRTTIPDKQRIILPSRHDSNILHELPQSSSGCSSR